MRFSTPQDIQNQINLIVKEYDDLFHAGNFKEVDDKLSILNIDNVEDEVIVAILATTKIAKDHLPSRAILVKKAEEILQCHEVPKLDQLMRILR
jgi:hypothetical protein